MPSNTFGFLVILTTDIFMATTANQRKMRILPHRLRYGDVSKHRGNVFGNVFLPSKFIFKTKGMNNFKSQTYFQCRPTSIQHVVTAFSRFHSCWNCWHAVTFLKQSCWEEFQRSKNIHSSLWYQWNVTQPKGLKSIYFIKCCRRINLVKFPFSWMLRRIISNVHLCANKQRVVSVRKQTVVKIGQSRNDN